MSVAQNMAFALELARVPAREVSRRVSRAADILGITRLLDRKPSALSGGQRQRVAIGRCIVREPRIFLFDEPLSNLDAKLRSHMRAELATLHRRLGKTTVYVTHDQIEAMTLASRIAIFDKGVVQQVGTPAEVFERPANLFVAAFVGTPAMNLLPAAIAPDGRIQGDGFTLAHPASAIPPGRECTVGIRPHALRECDADSAAITICVDLVEYIGAESVVSGTLARNDGIRVLAALPGQRNDLHGSLLGLAVDTAALHLFDRRTGMNLSH
ncbi:MAG: ATP-binding cassette domain-containing protein [Bordetella sp.]|nr:ATP-binding cassette domain-containing protein [Bordetella sp.]